MKTLFSWQWSAEISPDFFPAGRFLRRHLAGKSHQILFYFIFYFCWVFYVLGVFHNISMLFEQNRKFRRWERLIQWLFVRCMTYYTIFSITAVYVRTARMETRFHPFSNIFQPSQVPLIRWPTFIYQINFMENLLYHHMCQ